jgi:hypothetical protein
LNPGTPTYIYNNTAASGTRLYRVGGTVGSAIEVTDLMEAMAYVTRTRSHAAGRVGATRGSVAASVSLSEFGENESDHSAEWVYSIQAMYPCFKELMKRFELTPTADEAP